MRNDTEIGTSVVLLLNYENLCCVYADVYYIIIHRRVNTLCRFLPASMRQRSIIDFFKF